MTPSGRPLLPRGIPVIFGAMFLATWWGVARLSERFIWGEGHQDRPIWMFVGLYLAAFGVYLAAYFIVRRTPRQASGWQYPPCLPSILGVINFVNCQEAYPLLQVPSISGGRRRAGLRVKGR